jgi:hypothetical protein
MTFRNGPVMFDGRIVVTIQLRELSEKTQPARVGVSGRLVHHGQGVELGRRVSPLPDDENHRHHVGLAEPSLS